jgi:hypothetical protein
MNSKDAGGVQGPYSWAYFCIRSCILDNGPVLYNDNGSFVYNGNESFVYNGNESFVYNSNRPFLYSTSLILNGTAVSATEFCHPGFG